MKRKLIDFICIVIIKLCMSLGQLLHHLLLTDQTGFVVAVPQLSKHALSIDRHR